MRSRQVDSKGGKTAVVSLLAAAALSAGLILAAAPATRASDRDPFTAQLDALKTSTSLAGANPDLVFEMHRKRTGCRLRRPTEEPPTYFSGNCRTSDDPDYQTPYDPSDPIGASDLYLEQNLKKIEIGLGSALLPDPNATGGQFADCRRRWSAQDPQTETYVFFCNPAALVGTGRIETALCYPWPETEEEEGILTRKVGCIPEDLRTGVALGPNNLLTALYLGRPRPQEKEAGRLTLIWPGSGDRPEGGAGLVAVDTSVRAKVTKSGIEIEALADNIPDVYDLNISRPISRPIDCRDEEEWHPPVGGVFSCITLNRPSAQLDTVKMRLFGDTGIGSGHPLLTNSTTCERQRLGAAFGGYLNSSMWDMPGTYEVYGSTPVSFRSGFGNGKTTAGSAPYQATGCEKVKFDPQIRIGLDQSDSAAQADKVLGVDAVITQREREGGIGRVETEFDASGITVNTENKVKACAPKDFDEAKCDSSAVVGSVDATSPLLYENQKALTGDDPVFRGPAYLLGIKGDEVQLGLRLEGTIGTQKLSLPLTGIGKVAGGKLRVVFTNPYKVPLSSFGLHISGDKERGVLKSSRLCPSSPRVTTTLTNQNGDKSVVRSQTVRIYGCKDPTFNAELSETEAGKPTTLTLQLAGNAKLSSGSVSFDLPRELMLATKQGKQAAGTQDGNLKVETPEGTFQAPLAFLGEGSNLTLGTLKGQGSAALSGLGGAVSLNSVALPAKEVKKKTKKRSKRAKKAGKGKAKRLAIQLTSTGTGELKLQGLPQDLTGAELSLGNNARQVFLITAKSCGQILPFTANVKTADGRSLQLKDFVRLDPCENKQATGKKRQKARKHKRRGAKR